MNKKLAFIWDFPVEPLELYGWQDGLYMALKVLTKKYNIDVYPIVTDNTTTIYEQIGMLKPDFILCWGSLDRPSFGSIRQFDIPTGLCFAGGTTEHGNRLNFDVIFVENDEYVRDFDKLEQKVEKAFGINDLLFVPTINLQPHYKAIYPAAFIEWKRHQLFAKAVGKNGLAVGGVISKDSLNKCLQEGTMVMPKVAYETLPFLIAQSQCVLVTANNQGGSQRTVLEAMAMNKPVIVMSDNTKCVEYVKESGVGLIADPMVDSIKDALIRIKDSKFDLGRRFIESKYSAVHYADELYAGIRKYL